MEHKKEEFIKLVRGFVDFLYKSNPYDNKFRAMADEFIIDLQEIEDEGVLQDMLMTFSLISEEIIAAIEEHRPEIAGEIWDYEYYKYKIFEDEYEIFSSRLEK